VVFSSPPGLADDGSIGGAKCPLLRTLASHGDFITEQRAGPVVRAQGLMRPGNPPGRSREGGRLSGSKWVQMQTVLAFIFVTGCEHSDAKRYQLQEI
jgi:hypothetical protein